MDSLDLNKLPAFIAVARERSFTRAAAQLGMSQSALSHAIRKMEESLGLRLLTRTTRGVSPTEAGERLLASIGPHYAAIQSGLSAMAELRDTPAGTFRISAHDHAASTILWPKLSPLLQLHPDLNIEISISYGMIDIVAERYDAGVRIGGCVAKDMVAVRIGPDLRMVVAGSPPISSATLRQRRRPVCWSTTASTCACPRTAACMHGNLQGMARNSRSRCAGKWFLIPRRKCSRPRWKATAWRMCRKRPSPGAWPMGIC